MLAKVALILLLVAVINVESGVKLPFGKGLKGLKGAGLPVGPLVVRVPLPAAPLILSPIRPKSSLGAPSSLGFHQFNNLNGLGGLEDFADLGDLDLDYLSDIDGLAGAGVDDLLL